MKRVADADRSMARLDIGTAERSRLLRTGEVILKIYQAQVVLEYAETNLKPHS
jgi:hypothetical protein